MALFDDIARAERSRHTMRDVVAQNLFLHALAFAIQAFEPLCDFARADGVRQCKQVDNIASVFHSPRGVQAWADPKPHIAGADPFARETRKLD